MGFKASRHHLSSWPLLYTDLIPLTHTDMINGKNVSCLYIYFSGLPLEIFIKCLHASLHRLRLPPSQINTLGYSEICTVCLVPIHVIYCYTVKTHLELFHSDGILKSVLVNLHALKIDLPGKFTMPHKTERSMSYWLMRGH